MTIILQKKFCARENLAGAVLQVFDFQVFNFSAF